MLLPSVPIRGDFRSTFAAAIEQRLRPGEHQSGGGAPNRMTFGRIQGLARGVIVEDSAQRRVFRLYIAFDLKDRLAWLEGEASQQDDWNSFTPVLNSFISGFQFRGAADRRSGW
jgi:hypothetical protein